MLIADKREFAKGMLLSITFFIILAVMFSPIFKGANAFKAADRLFNSIAKGSSYYIPKLLEENASYKGSAFEVTITLKSKEMARNAETLLTQAGAEATGSDSQLSVTGDLGQVVKLALDDADAMFNNKGKEVAARYGTSEKEVLLIWWNVCKEMAKDLTRQKKFRDAAHLEDIMKKGIEVGYNFYGIEPQKASSKAGILGFSLIFYVAYTLCWGYAILYLFHGLGLEMKAGKRKEV